MPGADVEEPTRFTCGIHPPGATMEFEAAPNAELGGVGKNGPGPCPPPIIGSIENPGLLSNRMFPWSLPIACCWYPYMSDCDVDAVVVAVVACCWRDNLGSRVARERGSRPCCCIIC